MRQLFVHEAVVVLGPGGDPRAPGAAITVELCGHWDHEPPCPLAAHRTTARAQDDGLHLQVIVATRPVSEVEVRRRIETALRSGTLTGPDGTTTVWQLLETGPGVLTADIERQAAGLLEN